MSLYLYYFFIPICGMVLRSIISRYPHSGEGKSPMFGDFEAQRHWMEITTSLPATLWYENSTFNDLNYWGLDYPPLTAYHSLYIGKVGELFDATWFAPYKSRGLESESLKLFMRSTVLLADAMTLLPSFNILLYNFDKISKQTVLPIFYALSLIVISPPLILIDHGHFQFNCISLGLFVFALIFFLNDFDCTGTFFFTCAVFYKQMEFYHALPFAFYLLGKCFSSSFSSALKHIFKLFTVVIITVLVIFLPYLRNLESIKQIITRIFPVNRGIFEDKVSNFWCVTSPIFRWREHFDNNQLIILCLISTMVTALPQCFRLLVTPSKKLLLYVHCSTSLAFFLFSYHVHEKSILLALTPALCLFPLEPNLVFNFSIASTLSMWPLLLKDGLALPAIILPLISIIVYYMIVSEVKNLDSNNRNLKVHILTLGTFFLVIVLSRVVTPPLKYPFIFDLSISGLSFLYFFMYYLIFLQKSLSVI